MQPERTAAECIDWSIKCPSIFTRKRPLAVNSKRRTATGVLRYVLGGDPFIVSCNHGGDEFRGQSVRDPLATITGGSSGAHGFGVVAGTMTQVGYGEREGQPPRCLDVKAPIGTLVGSGKHAAVAASMHRIGQTGSNGGHVQPVTAPVGAIVSKAEHCLHAANLTQMRGSNRGNGGDLRTPGPSICSQGTHAGLIDSKLAHLAKYYGTGGQWQGCGEPLHTATGGARFAVVEVSGRVLGELSKAELRGALRVGGFLRRHGEKKYRDRLTMVRDERDGKVKPIAVVWLDGVAWVITDIGLRMLRPRELFNCQGFPSDYVLTGTERSQVARCGNSVPPPVAAALVRASWERRAVA